jgi:hypothetical protein
MRITRFIGKSRKNIAAVGNSGSPIIIAKLKNARIERNARNENIPEKPRRTMSSNSVRTGEDSILDNAV